MPEKNAMWQNGQKTNYIQGGVLPSRSLCPRLQSLFHLDLLEQRNPFMCMESTVYSLFTLQFWEKFLDLYLPRPSRCAVTAVEKY